MRILVLSKHGDGLGLAARMAREGHHVEMFIQSATETYTGQGLVEILASWRPALPDADLLVCDSVGFGGYENILKMFGRPFLGCSYTWDLMNDSPDRQFQLLRGANVPTVEHVTLPVEEAMDYVLGKGFERGVLIKQDKDLPVESVAVLEFILGKMPDTHVTLQPMYPGIKYSLTGWFNGSEWVEPYLLSFPERGLLPEGLGTGIEDVGISVVGVPSCPLTSDIELLTPALKHLGYRGLATLDMIGSPQNRLASGLRMGLWYDLGHALLEGIREDLGHTLFQLASGTLSTESLSFSTSYLTSIRVSMPPWPYARPSGMLVGMPITGIVEQQVQHISWRGVYLEDTYRVSGSDGVILNANAAGESWRESRKRALRLCEGVQIPYKQYRPDVGLAADRGFNELKRMGHLAGAEEKVA